MAGGGVTAPNPRVGGGTDGDSWWTGGSNIQAQKRKKYASSHARRPTTFRDAEKVETACQAPLPEELRLGLMTETDHTTSLQQWIREIKTKIVACGMDTVFYP